MSGERRHKQIVKTLLLLGTALCLGISAAAIAIYSHTWPRLNDPAPADDLSFNTLLSLHAGSLLIFALFLPLCLAKLQLGNRMKLWEPKMTQGFILIAFLFLSFSPFLFPPGIAGFYYSRKVSPKDFE